MGGDERYDFPLALRVVRHAICVMRDVRGDVMRYVAWYVMCYVMRHVGSAVRRCPPDRHRQEWACSSIG